MECLPWVPVSTTAGVVLEAASAVLGYRLPEWICCVLREHREYQGEHSLSTQKAGHTESMALWSLNGSWKRGFQHKEKDCLAGGIPTGAKAKVKKHRSSEGWILGNSDSLA